MNDVLRVHKNDDNAKVYQLSYDISQKSINWYEVFKMLMEDGYFCLDEQHLFGIPHYGATLYAVRPVKSSWIFFSKKTQDDIDTYLSTKLPSDFMYALSEVALQKNGDVAKLNYDYNLQWQFDDKLDWTIQNG